MLIMKSWVLLMLISEEGIMTVIRRKYAQLLDDEILIMVNMPDGVKHSERSKPCNTHYDRQSGLEFSFYSQNSDLRKHDECIVCEVVLSISTFC